MIKLTAENVIFISYIKKSCHIELQPFDSHYAIFHLCEFSLVPKCAYLEDPLYINLVSISKDITSLFWIENYSDFKYFSFPFFRSENPDQYSKIFNNKQSLW